MDARLNHIFGGAAALVEDGHIRFAVAEERITRRKYDGGYTSALRYLLDRTGLCLEDIDYFYLTFYGSSLRVAKDLIAIHLEDLRVNDDKLIVIPSHHESHAALAYFLSPFSDALTVVADNEGSVLGTFDPNKPLKDQWCERNTYYWCWDNQYQLLERDFAGPGEKGFGKAYNKFTRYLGFGDYHHAGKTMGLSAYGTQSNLLSGPSLWGTTNKGDLVSKMKDTNDYTKDLPVFFGQYDINIPSPAARHCAQVPEYQALAAFVQSELQRWIAIRCGDLMRRVSTKHLCISGGVATMVDFRLVGL